MEKTTSTKKSSLPDDLLLSCLPRVSRLYYPTLSLVSKSFQSFLTSPEIYQIRSSLGRTECCLYVCIQSFRDLPHSRWLTLCRKPDRTLINEKTKKPSGYVLAEIPVGLSRPAHCVVAVGSNIYNIGGPIDKNHSSNVSILDCKSHTWREGPSMRVERKNPAANVLDGKIYVTGGCKECNSSTCLEVFDPKTETWESVSYPSMRICGPTIFQSAVIDGEIFWFGRCNLAYKPKEGRWRFIERERGEKDMCLKWHYRTCVIDNVYYSYYDEEFKWYDTNVRVWKILKSVKGLPKFARAEGMVDYGGKLAIFWVKNMPSSGYKDKMIWCAVIELERRNSEEIWGEVEWYDAVLSVPMSLGYHLYHAVLLLLFDEPTYNVVNLNGCCEYCHFV